MGGPWYRTVAAAFLRGYREGAGGASFMPHSDDELTLLLSSSMLHKVLYELSYELNNRPDWVAVPLRGLLDLLGPGSGLSRRGNDQGVATQRDHPVNRNDVTRHEQLCYPARLLVVGQILEPAQRVARVVQYEFAGKVELTGHECLLHLI